MGMIKITPDKEKARSMLKMAKTTMDMASAIDYKRFPSNIIVEFYNVARQLMAVIALLDGFKTKGEGAHRTLIEYTAQNYKKLSAYEIHLLYDLRTLRNRIGIVEPLGVQIQLLNYTSTAN